MSSAHSDVQLDADHKPDADRERICANWAVADPDPDPDPHHVCSVYLCRDAVQLTEDRWILPSEEADGGMKPVQTALVKASQGTYVGLTHLLIPPCRHRIS